MPLAGDRIPYPLGGSEASMRNAISGPRPGVSMTSAIVRYSGPCGIGGGGGRVFGTVDPAFDAGRRGLSTGGRPRSTVTRLGGVGNVTVGCGRVVIGTDCVTDGATDVVVTADDIEAGAAEPVD